MASNRPHTLKDEVRLNSIPTRRREPLTQEQTDLVHRLVNTEISLEEYFTLNREVANRIAQARDEQWRAEHEECSCQPDLPDGRQSSQTCPVCRSEEKEIPF